MKQAISSAGLRACMCAEGILTRLRHDAGTEACTTEQQDIVRKPYRCQKTFGGLPDSSLRFRQQGASLIVALLMLVVVLLLGISAATIALQGEKASRNDRDRQIALQAAEAALMDAELDIEHSPDAEKSRSPIFAKDKTEGFTDGCAGGDTNIYLGLCSHAEAGAIPVWQSIDFLDEESSTMTSVPYGKFTGQSFQTGKGSLPGRLPRYIIELMTYNKQGESADLSGRTYFYRVTAIGFGARDTTQVVLQTFYRKDK